MRIGLMSIVFLVLLVLKLCGLAAISWFVVFLPLLITAFFWILITIIFITMVIFGCIKEYKS
jgi:hypothetical protein